jgi:adenosylhomocysteine nucleosidase
MATKQEYTPALAAMITPLITGVGPVEGGVSLAGALGRLAAQGEAPEVVVALGSAGSRSLDHAGIYQAASVSYRDMDCSALGFPRGVTPFLDERPVIDLGPPIAGLRPARLSSGGGIISGADYDAIDADMVDMETYSFARAARHFGARLIVLRGISDGRAPLSGQITDWTHTLEEIGEGLATALRQVHQAIEAG